jgi:hypothetical protein
VPTVEQRLTSLENLLKNNTYGSALKWRASNMNVTQASDITSNLGSMNAGNWELGQALGRRIVISDIDHGIIDYDEMNRPYKRETYTTVYYRLGLAGVPGIDYNGTTGSPEIDGRCNLDDTIPFKALDFSTVTSGFVYDKTTGRIVSLGMQTVDGKETASYNTNNILLSWANDDKTTNANISVGESGLSLGGTGRVAIAPLFKDGEADSTLYTDYDRVVVAGGYFQFMASPNNNLWPSRPTSAGNFTICPNATTGLLEVKLNGAWYTINTTAVT